MRRRLIVIAFVVAVTLPPAVTRPAMACSCAATDDRPAIEFVGVALDSSRRGPGGSVWRFHVANGRGVPVGEVVEIQLAVNRQSPDGSFEMSSSCSLGDAPIAGEQYRVGAYQGTVYDRVEYFANLCGGYLEATGVDSPQAPPSRPPVALLVIASLALVGAVVASARAARRSGATG